MGNQRKKQKVQEYSDDDDSDQSDFAEVRDQTITMAEATKSFGGDSLKCYGCLYPFTTTSLQDKCNLLSNLYHKHKDSTSDEILAKILCDAHTKLILEPAHKAGDFDVLEWTEAQVIDHLRHHMTDVHREIINSITKYAKMEKLIEGEGLFRRSADNSVKIDKNAFVVLNMLGNLKAKYYGVLKKL
jgi:hypothetical protein